MGHRASNHAIFYRYPTFILIVLHMEMRWLMVTYVHIYNNTVKGTYLRHNGFFYLFLLANIRSFFVSSKQKGEKVLCFRFKLTG